MIQETESKVTVLYKDTGMADLFDLLDQLHTAASEDQLHKLTTLPRQEVVAWLEEVIYTAKETIHEITRDKARPQNIIHLMDRPEFKKSRLS